MNEEAILEMVARILTGSGETLVTAESCTGGLIGYRLTSVPGSSSWYLGGFVTYRDSLKQTVLGVGQVTLATHGAVSAPVALEMAAGARSATGADRAVAVTGVAGPGGGTPEKPVGLVFVAVAGSRGTKVARYCFAGDRESVRQQAAGAALALLAETLHDD
jgi:PncC family amidohydrolase